MEIAAFFLFDMFKIETIPYFVPKSLESSFIPTQADPHAIPLGRICNVKTMPTSTTNDKTSIAFIAFCGDIISRCIISQRISQEFMFAFGKFPIPDLNFFAVHTLGKLTCFYKFVRHGNKKLLAVSFHQIKLFIRVFYRVD